MKYVGIIVMDNGTRYETRRYYHLSLVARDLDEKEKELQRVINEDGRWAQTVSWGQYEVTENGYKPVCVNGFRAC